MKNLMMLYGVTLRKRYTKRQKSYFISQVNDVYPKYGFPVSFQEKTSRLFSIRNVIAGDVKRANTVFVAAYDTPSRAILPNIKYYPFHAEKNIRFENWNLLMQIVLSLLLAFATFLSLKLFLNAQGLSRVLFSLLTVPLAILTFLTAKVQPNRFNFNRNSASLAVMERIAENCKFNPEIAFVFLDQAVSSYEGLKLFYETLGDTAKNVIVMDSISSGDVLLLANRQYTKDKVEQLTKLAKRFQLKISNRQYSEEKAERNVLNLHKYMLYLVSGTVEGKEFAVKNTRSKKDINVDIKRLEAIAQTMTDYISECEVQL